MERSSFELAQRTSALNPDPAVRQRQSLATQGSLVWLLPLMMLSATGLGISLSAVVVSFNLQLDPAQLAGLVVLSVLQLCALLAIGKLIWQNCKTGR